jgi:molecular chaperone IbpA
MNTTTRRFNTDLLNDPFFIGFDGIFNKMHQINKNTTNYPPYNLIKTGDDSYLIELAVAGFNEKDIDIELHNGVLTIKAEIGNVDNPITYLHKGIAARSFERKFTLADTIEVIGVQLYNGMLHVRLENIIPEEKKPKKIPIGASTPVALSRQLLTEDE